MKTKTLEALMTIKKNLPRVQDLCSNYPEILSKAVVTRLIKDNKRVQSLQWNNITEIDADSEASSFGYEYKISLDEFELDNELHNSDYI